MRRIPETIKRRLVELLGCYYTPSEVARLIQLEFDMLLTTRHVRAYDPTSFQFVAARRWEEYFWAARKRFENEIADVPIARRAFRLRRLTVLYDRAFEKGDMAEARSCLEQAAKEVGEWFKRS